MQNPNQEILKSIIDLVNNKTDHKHRNWTKMYRLMQQHPKLYRNQNQRYPQELFREGANMAWASFNQRRIQEILQNLEQDGIEITLTNANRIISALILYLNRMAINQTISIWRKETYLVA
jgi:hemolysin-activating ACP:hemolysin acyltransferase